MNSYLPEERRQQISEILQSEGKVTVIGLAERLNTSVDTIRRDLKELEENGRLTRVHGGALPPSPVPSPYYKRQTENRPAKHAIALEACKLIQQDQVVFIDGGTTPVEVARNFAVDMRLTVVTVSPNVLDVISHSPYIKAVMVGGTYDPVSRTIVGSAAIDFISQIKADICILGVCSLDVAYGVTTNGFEESKIKKLMIQNSSEVVAVATADKLGTAAAYKASSIDDITHIVTESGVADSVATPFLEKGIQVITGKNEYIVNLNFR